MAARDDWAPHFKACHDPPINGAGPTCYELEWADRGNRCAQHDVDTADAEAAELEAADEVPEEADEVPEEAGVVTCVDCDGAFEPSEAVIWRGDDRFYCRECFAAY